jgi:predicted short-subunit dehydrogenase-like oxidoreductase (DUF2520 family)
MQIVDQRIAVVGLGRLGMCLARAVHASGLRLSAVASAHIQKAHELVALLDQNVAALPLDEIADHAELILLAVPDAQITEVSAALTVGARHSVVHTSGVLDTGVLASAAAHGVRCGVFHPLQAFARGAEPTIFHGIQIGVEADDLLEPALRQLAERLGAQAFSLRGVERAAYHAAAVFASNYLVALHAVAARIWTQAGLPEASARDALMPLTRGALQALAEHEPSAALTGPLRRGDEASLALHLRALEQDPNATTLYRALARELLALPLGLDPAVRARIASLLDERAR